MDDQSIRGFLEETVRITAEMRRWQKLYFKSRNGDQLREAKRLEKELDDRLSKFLDGTFKQAKLFQ